MTDIIKQFWENQASGWSPENRNPLVGWYDEHNADETEQKLLFRGVKTDGSLVALEYGCGPGRNIIKHKDLFARIDGVDINRTILDKASDFLKDNNINDVYLFHTNGFELNGQYCDIKSTTYDVVFSIICLQHIGSWEWRQSLWNEFYRVLKPKGVLTFQMGYGPGHPISVDYFHNYDETDDMHRDVRIESEGYLVDDLRKAGFKDITLEITNPTHDQHPHWIWVQARK